MAQVLVTGATGMIGSHLLAHLRNSPPGAVVGTAFGPPSELPAPPAHVMLPLDVRDGPALRDCIARHRPAVIHHLAAQSLPTLSWTEPRLTLDTNVQGTVNVFEAVQHVRDTIDADYDPMVVVACSSAEYGASMTPERVPLDEEAPLLPLHPYGVSKVAQDLLAFQVLAQPAHPLHPRAHLQHHRAGQARRRGLRLRRPRRAHPRRGRHAARRQSRRAAADHGRARHDRGPAAAGRARRAGRGLQRVRRHRRADRRADP